MTFYNHPPILAAIAFATAGIGPSGAQALLCPPTNNNSGYTSSPTQFHGPCISSCRNRNQPNINLPRTRYYNNFGRRNAFTLPRGGFTRRFSSDDLNDISEDSTSEEETIVQQQKRKLSLEFFTIAIPAFVQLAAEPLAGLVDTAYLGRLGPEVLGGAGVAISAQYAVSKLYNDPLLRTSISLVASEDGKKKKAEDDEHINGNVSNESSNSQALSIAVSSALLLAFTVGAVQLVLYYSFASSILNGMGVSPTSPMHHSAFSYLRVRALGTPAATLWLVTNGIFRGLGDTRTPLKYSIFFTALNAILDPLFIFTLKQGASGAAAGTALAQYTALIPLLWSLHRKVGVDVLGQWKELGATLKEYVKAGSFVLLRTVGKVLAYSVCAREAVRCQVIRCLLHIP